jgi:signal transduction histidine kinase
MTGLASSVRIRPSPFLVEAKDVSIKFGNIVALDHVNFRVGRNELVGLLGDNGAGKSTLIKALVGYHGISSGQILFEGKEIRFQSPGQAYQAGIEVAYQELALAKDLTILQNFFLGRELCRRFGPLTFLDRKSMKKVIRGILDEAGFPGKLFSEHIHYLPGGLRQIIEIFRANYFVSKLLILDEPTAALSESETSKALQMVKRVKENGMSAIFVTHSAHEVFQVADRFVVLRNGRNFVDLKREDTSLQELEKLIISSRMSVMKEIVGSVAHQLRNPLGIIKFSAEMLADDYAVNNDNGSYGRIVSMIINEVEVLENVVSNFLNFVRPVKLSPKPVLVEELIRDLIETLRIGDFHGIEVGVDIRKNLPKLLMDECLMKQALTNVVLNAMEASSPGGKIQIRAFMEHACLVIEVQDWGLGIEEEMLQKLFHPFFSTKTVGTGLGLAIVKQIVESHGGTVEVRSRRGEGSTFRFLLKGR